MNKKVAFVTGISGQDSAYLAKYLLEKDYKVIGGARRTAERSLWRLKRMDILDKIEIVDFDLLDYTNMVEVIKKYQPDEIYNLAAQSFVGSSFKQPISTLDITGIGACHLLDIVRLFSPHSKFYQASSSEMFGEVRETPQSENTSFNPSSPYGCAKLLAHTFCETYRKSYGMFVCCGILFNHESLLRGDEFVTKKITNYVGDYRDKKTEKPLELGNIHAERDWGYAGDYVEAMWMMMQMPTPDSYVIGTGKKETVKSFVGMAFSAIGVNLRWNGEDLNEKGVCIETGNTLVVINSDFYRPNDVETLLADASKAKEVLNWTPKVTLSELVKKMVSNVV